MARLAIALLGLASAAAEEWAVLVAGSSGFYNYRHQADVCHAYHLLVARGLHPDRIITMMYDDVANDTENPYRGRLYNRPWEKMQEAKDVYAGCKVDYRGKQVNPKQFLAVLSGDASAAGGKVLRSGAQDHVFVNFVDHGAVGLIAFPESGRDQVLHAKQLVATLERMHRGGAFAQLVFYLETCESGSMFEGLLPDALPVYAVTAANAHESSWGTFCGAAARVGGVDIGTCLGDLFSVNWLADSESAPHGKETLNAQFQRVKQATNKSHVMRYGQVRRFGPEHVSDFQGPAGQALGAEPTLDAALAEASAVDSRHVRLHYLRRRYERTASEADAELLQAELRQEEEVAGLGEALAGEELRSAPGGVSWTPARLACHERAVEEFGASCGWSDARLPLSKALYILCAAGAPTTSVVDRVREVCRAQQAGEIWA